ncbi:hypothetical protein Tco_0352474 [Tanacetum coccineum]
MITNIRKEFFPLLSKLIGQFAFWFQDLLPLIQENFNSGRVAFTELQNLTTHIFMMCRGFDQLASVEVFSPVGMNTWDISVLDLFVVLRVSGVLLDVVPGAITKSFLGGQLDRSIGWYTLSMLKIGFGAKVSAFFLLLLSMDQNICSGVRFLWGAKLSQISQGVSSKYHDLVPQTEYSIHMMVSRASCRLDLQMKRFAMSLDVVVGSSFTNLQSRMHALISFQRHGSSWSFFLVPYHPYRHQNWWNCSPASLNPRVALVVVDHSRAMCPDSLQL